VALLPEAQDKKGNRVDEVNADQLSKQIDRIQQLSTDLKHNLAFLRDRHSAFGILLMELDLLTYQLAEIKKRLE